MSCNVVAESKKMFRIEEDGGGTITASVLRGIGYIRYIFVPEENRLGGVGSELLLSAEAELLARGASRIEADYLESYQDVTKLFESNGYEVEPSRPVLTVEMDRLLSSKAVEKAMLFSIDGAFFIPLEDLFGLQIDKVLRVFKKLSIPISLSDTNDFSGMESGIVYDEKMIPKAFIFCSHIGDDLYVDFLGGASKAEPQFIMMAVQSMIHAVRQDAEEGGEIRRLIMFAADAEVNTLLRRALGKRQTPDILEETVTAGKDLGASEHTEASSINSTGMDPEELLNTELSRIPIQKNICWKAGYIRKGR